MHGPVEVDLTTALIQAAVYVIPPQRSRLRLCEVSIGRLPWMSMRTGSMQIFEMLSLGDEDPVDLNAQFHDC